MRNYHHNPDPEIDAGILQECAAAARADLAAGLKCHCCPVCGIDHGRGWVAGGDTYRCMTHGEFPPTPEDS